MRRLFLLLALIALFFAQGPSEELKKDVLEARYAKIECRFTFFKNVLADAQEAGVNVSIDDLTNSMESNMAELKSAADAGDVAAFRDALAALHEDAKEAIKKYREVRESLKGPENKDLRKELREAFVNERQAMADCVGDSSIGLGRAHLEWLKAWRERAHNVSNRLSGKKMYTAELESIIAEGDEQIESLQDAVDSGNGSRVAEVEREVRERYLHIWARFHIERLRILLRALEERAIEKGYQEDVDAIAALLDGAAGKVKVGEPYNDGEFETVRSAIKDAASQLRELFKKIKKGL